MTRWKLALVAMLFWMVVPASFARSGSPQRERIDVSTRGPQVGERIPDFRLDDQFGQTWTRASILGENGTMLVFIRSADW